jgi:hypothetical protein
MRREWWLITLFHSDPGSIVTVSIDFSYYLSLYLLPELVLTICPALAPLGTGDVVIFVPFLKLFEFETLPVSEPSAF